MMPVSLRRENAATRIVLTMSSTVTTSIAIGHDQGDRLQTTEELEEPVEERPLIIDLLHPGSTDECRRHDVVLRRVAEFDPE